MFYIYFILDLSKIFKYFWLFDNWFFIANKKCADDIPIGLEMFRNNFEPVWKFLRKRFNYSYIFLFVLQYKTFIRNVLQ